MKVSAALALRCIKVQKKHSAFIVVCVALSVALTSFFLIMFSTVNDSRKMTAENTCGTWEACINGLTREQAEMLSHNAAFSAAEMIPFQSSIEMTDDDGNTFYLRSDVTIDDGSNLPADAFSFRYSLGMSINAMGISESKLMPEILAEGRFPQNDSEIVIGSMAPYNIGDKITLKAQTIKDYGIISGKEDEILEEQTKEYTVCGRSNIESGASCCYPEDSFILSGGDIPPTHRLLVKFSDTSANFRTTVIGLCESVGMQLSRVDEYSGAALEFMHENTCYFNKDYLTGAAIGSEARSELVTYYAMMYIVVLLVLAAGRMIIDCEFELSAAKMHKQLGLLMSIGATDRQLVEITVIQGLVLGIIAVPLGLLLGYFFAALALAVLMSDNNIAYVIEQAAGGEIRLSAYPILMFLAGITGIGWVFFSSYGTAVRIKKVNPTEAVRGMRKKGKLPYPKRKASEKVTPKSFINTMAISTMKIERKRFFTSALAIAVSIVFFTLITFGVKLVREYYYAENGYIEYYSNDYFSVNRVSNSAEIKELAERIDSSGFFSVYSKDTVGEYNISGIAETYRGSYSCTVYPISREHYERLFADSPITYDEAVENRYAFRIEEEGKDDDGPDNLDLEVWSVNSVSMLGYDEKLHFEVKPVALPDKEENDPRGTGVGSYYVGFSGVYDCYAPEELVDEFIETQAEEYISGFSDLRTFGGFSFTLNDKSKYSEAMEWLKGNVPYYINDYFTVHNINQEALLRVISTVGYAIMIVAALIAVSNIVNITVSGITENRQGFALLKAAGMDDEQIEKTAFIQSLIPAAAGALAALVICGAAVIYVHSRIQTAIDESINIYGANTTQFRFYYGLIEMMIYPMKQFFIAAVSAAVISLISGIGPINEIENAPIAEAVKAEE